MRDGRATARAVVTALAPTKASSDDAWPRPSIDHRPTRDSRAALAEGAEAASAGELIRSRSAWWSGRSRSTTRRPCRSSPPAVACSSQVPAVSMAATAEQSTTTSSPAGHARPRAAARPGGAGPPSRTRCSAPGRPRPRARRLRGAGSLSFDPLQARLSLPPREERRSRRPHALPMNRTGVGGARSGVAAPCRRSHLRREGGSRRQGCTAAEGCHGASKGMSAGAESASEL